MDNNGQDLPARGPVSRRRLLRPAAMSVCFALLGACLLLASAGLLSEGGVSVQSAALPGGSGKLYLPAAGESAVLSLHADGEGGHVHEDIAVGGGPFSAALLLRSRLDGGEAAAVELCRRGVAVLLADEDVPAADAWNWLTEQSFVRVSSVALLAGTGRSGEALELADALVGSGRECAAVILLGDEQLLRGAAGSPCRDLLILTAREPDAGAKGAFFGEDFDPSRVFTGYFSEGTARACEAVGGAPAFSDRDVLARIIDWQGSSLGHAVEIPDDDLVYDEILFCRIGAWACFALAALVWLRRRYVISG